MARYSRQESGSGSQGRSFCPAAAMLLVVAAVADNPARGQAGPGDPEKATRLQAMERVARGVVMRKVDGGASEPIAPLDNPIYRFDDPARSYSDGTVWAWGRPGRPAALLTLSLEKKEGVLRWLGELTSLSAPSITAAGPEGWAWTPQAAGAVANPLPDTPRPAEDEARRLRQMRDAARRFRAFEFFAPVNRTQLELERFELRLLPQPVHRYSDPGSGLVDGAIFVFAYGTNPEIVLLIEARREGKDESGASWTYGLARVAGAELHVELDHHEVWKQPRVPMPSRRDPYAIIVIPALEE